MTGSHATPTTSWCSRPSTAPTRSGLPSPSTIAPAAAQEIAARLVARGVSALDAPVSGGEPGAVAGSLTIMVGGEAEAFATVKPLLEAMGKSVTLIGAAGAGQVAKACNQILTGVGVAAVAEALNFAHKSGVDAGRVREALLGGFAYSRILENHGQRMLERFFDSVDVGLGGVTEYA